MKIVHVYTKNVDMFVNAVKGTDLKLNARNDLKFLINSLQDYNARDVLGLIVFANPVTKNCLRLVKKFDNLFPFQTLPIVIINDNAHELYANGYFHTRNAKVFLLDSEDNTISDVELNSVFTTLLAFSDTMYDLSVIGHEKRSQDVGIATEFSDPKMSKQLVDLLGWLKESSNEDSTGYSWCVQEKELKEQRQ